MSIPTAWLDQLRERTSLSTLIQRSVPLKRAGREWKACCPFHQEKSPSFHVNDEKGFYHCFGCSAHGDAIRWMTDHEGMGFIDAVKELALQAGMEVPAQDPRAVERERARDGDLDVMDRAAQRFAFTLEAGANPAPGSYLAKRGIQLADLRKFGIGFAPKVRLGERPFIAEVDSNPERLIALGLMGRHEGTGRLYDFFRDRITIPIHDARGRVIGFGGRIIGDGQPKYLNSPDTNVFDKGRTLFNLHRASPAARAKDRLIIVEGYFDVIGLASVGIEEAVAPNGTALTEAQLMLAWKLVDEPTIWLDGDKAGRAAAMRAALRALPLLTPGKGLWFVLPPEGQDPDDVAREGGADAVSAALAKRESLLDIIWRDALEKLNAAKGETATTSRVRRDLRDLLGTIKDIDVRSVFANAIQSRLANYTNRSSIVRHRSAAPARQAVNEAMQDSVAKGILRHIDHLHIMAEDITQVTWLRADASRVLEALIWNVDEGAVVNTASLSTILESRGLGDDYRAIMARETLRTSFTYGPTTETTLADLQRTIRAQASN